MTRVRRAARRPARRVARLAIVGAALLVIVVAVTLLESAYQPYRVVSASMAPTAVVGQRILADHLGDERWVPQVGDIVVFDGPGGAREDAQRRCADGRPPHTACQAAIAGRTRIPLVKRVVAVGGDRLRIVRGRVVRNGVAAHEPYASSCDLELCDLAEFRVPAGTLYVLGDNRGDSSDSRVWGPIARGHVKGRALLTYWPPSRLGGL